MAKKNEKRQKHQQLAAWRAAQQRNNVSGNVVAVSTRGWTA